MQNYTKLEITVGVFIVLGSAALVYLSVSIGGLKLFATDQYNVIARFSSIGGLKQGDPVKIAGVTVGEVESIRLVDYVAETELSIQDVVKLPSDTIASIESNGLLGDAYVSLSPGAADAELGNGGKIQRTESAISLTELIAKYAFGSPVEGSSTTPEADSNEATIQEGGTGEPKASPFSDPLEE